MTDKALQRTCDLVHRRFGDDLLVRTPSGRQIRVTGTAVAAWEALTTPATTDELARRIQTAHPEYEPVPMPLLAEALHLLEESGLVEPVAPVANS